METFPPLLFPLICSSFCASVVGLILSSLVLSVSAVLWVVPGAFIVTFACLSVFILLKNSEATWMLRVYSAPTIGGAYILTTIWISALSVVITYTVFLWSGHHLANAANMKNKIWIMVSLGVVILAECFIMVAITFKAHKERRRLLYQDKWNWRPGATSNASQWSIGQT